MTFVSGQVIFSLLFYVAGGYGPDDGHRHRSLIETFSSIQDCENNKPMDTQRIKFECADAHDASRRMAQ